MPNLHKMSDATSNALRKAIHDLNGELFLIRGHVDLARASCPEGPVREQLDEIFRRTEQIAEISKRLRKLQIDSDRE